MIQIDYLFSPWMLMAITSTTIVVPSLHSWNITLRVCRVVPDSAIIFRFALDGNLQGMKMLFDAGSASAHDVDASTGTSPMDVACGRILGGTASPEITTALTEDFDIEEHLEERQLPVLHKIVLGLAEADLETQLRLSTMVKIDALDYQGRTALSWAAIRGDSASLNLLLKYGADPNVVAYNGDAPLRYATRAPDPRCVRPLLESGADVNAVNAWKGNPLAYTTAFRDDLRYLKPLLEKSVDMEHKDRHGRSALMRAVLNNRPNLVKCLLGNGAKLAEADAWGFRPLMVAVERKFHAVAHIILQSGTSELGVEPLSSVLEIALVSGDRQTVEMLEGLQSRVLNAGEEDSEVVGAATNDLKDLGTQNDTTQLQQAARALTTGFQASKPAVPVLVFRKEKVKAA
ncbi:hypothetical protein HO133_008968 [Letharia lupina]|uniref:Ankyrin n=1 Tax=Letharia lupina TaxID=560253 RepID=A0A8H6CME9_9LECA|nr:uncharacterized protein HO133_008968 [Letharia lupina]KAF6226103.1 hypothetical protein HO133_008968 [Letharia lupina]